MTTATRPGGPMIETHDLRRTFKARGGAVEAVRGVDLEVRAGEIFGFLGPNGAGKTTTLRMLATLLKPTGGRRDGRGRRPRPRSAGGPSPHRLRAAGRFDRSGRDRPRRARHPGPAVRPRQDRGPAPCRRGARGARARPPRPTARPAPTRAACAAASTSGSASSTARASCSSTSRRPGWTRRRAPACGTRSAALRELGHHGLPDHPLPRGGGRACRPPRDHRPRQDRGRGHRRLAQAAGRRRRHHARHRRRPRARPRSRPRRAVRPRGIGRGRAHPPLRRPGRQRRPAAHPAPRRSRPSRPAR